MWGMCVCFPDLEIIKQDKAGIFTRMKSFLVYLSLYKNCRDEGCHDYISDRFPLTVAH